MGVESRETGVKRPRGAVKITQAWSVLALLLPTQGPGRWKMKVRSRQAPYVPVAQTLFPASGTNRREIHIWDPLPAWPFPLPLGTEPSLSVCYNGGNTGGFQSFEEAPAHLSIADGFLEEQTPEIRKSE